MGERGYHFVSIAHRISSFAINYADTVYNIFLILKSMVFLDYITVSDILFNIICYE